MGRESLNEPVARLPSSKAALTVMALVSSKPLMPVSSSFVTAKSFDRGYFFNVSLAISKALLPARPVRIRIAKSSASLKFSAPFSDSFSLGLLCFGKSLIFIFFAYVKAHYQLMIYSAYIFWLILSLRINRNEENRSATSRKKFIKKFIIFYFFIKLLNPLR